MKSYWKRRNENAIYSVQTDKQTTWIHNNKMICEYHLLQHVERIIKQTKEMRRQNFKQNLREIRFEYIVF